VPLVFSIIVIPMTMLGAAYYPWERLDAIEWLKWAVLVNPLIYISEGFRMALTDIPHMNAWGIYGALVGFTAVLGRLGIVGFKRRVLA
jgi:ABC-2 type transport system permease protein